MDLTILQKTDSELIVMAGHKSTKRVATKEIQRRKAVGSWRLIANWQPEKEEAVEERTYAVGVVKR
jgi:hypothetical protein